MPAAARSATAGWRGLRQPRLGVRLEPATRAREYQVGPRRPEADDHDAAAHGYGTGSGVVVGGGAVIVRGAPGGGWTLPRPPRTTHRPYRGSTSTSARATFDSSWRWAAGDCCSRRWRGPVPRCS